MINKIDPLHYMDNPCDSNKRRFEDCYNLKPNDFKKDLLRALNIGLGHARETLRQYEISGYVDPGVQMVYLLDVKKIESAIKELCRRGGDIKTVE
jgi:hypothetical protein